MRICFFRSACLFVLAIVLLPPLCGFAEESEESPSLTLSRVAALENPTTRPYGGANAFVLKGMEPGVGRPALAVVWYGRTDQTEVDLRYSATLAVYDRDLTLLDTWEIGGGDHPVPDMIMRVVTGDVDGDGHREIVVNGRKRMAGVCVLKWNPSAKKLDTLWKHPFGATPSYFRGLAVGNFIPDSVNPGNEVALGGDGGSSAFYLFDREGKIVSRGLSKSHHTLQAMDVFDLDGDGVDELLACFGRSPGMVGLYGWSEKQRGMEAHWLLDLTPGRNLGDNCYEAEYHPGGLPGGGPAIAFATERESKYRFGAVGLIDLKHWKKKSNADPSVVWRYRYPEGCRAAGIEFADLTGDDVPEIMSRYSPRGEGRVLILDNRGNLLCNQTVDMGITSVGPYRFDYRGDRATHIVVSGNGHDGKSHVQVFKVAETIQQK